MPKTPDYFTGKTIVITGAGSGIGRATALIFAREGANVVCADINEDGVRETAAQVNAKGSQALALKVDVTSRKQVEDMVKRAVDAFGSVQFLFNCALPKASTVRLTMSSTCARWVTSTFRASAWLPLVLTSVAVSLTPASLRSAQITLAPSRAKMFAVARPMPLAAPVMTMVFPAK